MDVEWLILADSAQVVGGKLFLLGGGWENLVVNSSFPVQQICAIAASFRILWNETNQRHNVEIEVMDQDGQSIVQLNGQVEVGRPPGIPPGSAQRSQLGFSAVLTFDSPGSFVIIARIEGHEMKRTDFRVVAGIPAMAGTRPG